MIEKLFEIIYIIVECGEIIFNVISLFILFSTGIKGLYHYFKHKKNTTYEILEGSAGGLTFLLIGEVMHTIIVRDLNSVILVGGIVLMRVALTLLVHYEMKLEKVERS